LPCSNFGGLEGDVFRTASRPLLHCEGGCPRRVPSPRILGRGSQGAVTDVAAWAGRKSETAAPRVCLQAIVGRLPAVPARPGWLERFHFAYAGHRGDACQLGCDVTCAKTCVGRILGRPGLGRKTRDKGRVRRLNGGGAIPAGSGGLPGMAGRRRQARRSRGKEGDNAAGQGQGTARR